MEEKEEQLISKLMMSEHQAIESLLNELWINLDTPKVKAIFGRFKWLLDKHFYLEERAIFQIYLLSHDEDSIEVAELIKEHEEMRLLLDNIGKAIEQNINPDLRVFDDLIRKHASIEDKKFYPKLDKILSEEQKLKIIDNVRKVMNNYYKPIE